MTEKNDRWKSREWYGTTKNRWQQPAASSGRQSSADTWEHAKPKGKWIQVSADYEVLDARKKKKSRRPKVAGKARKEKQTCTHCLKMRLQMKKE